MTFARGFRALLPVALFAALTAHVGSPNVVFEGAAGPYPVNVVVQPPDVVPGLAQVIVRLDSSARDVRRVNLRPVFWKAGVNGAPSGDDAKPVAGRIGLYSGQLWLMSRGAYSVYVTVEGGRGSGTAIVPVNAFATGRLGLSRGLSAILVVLGCVLVAGFVTIIRAASGEALLEPGQAPNTDTRRKARTVSVVAATIIGVAILGGAKWWNAVDRDYRRTMYRPPAVDLRIRQEKQGNALWMHVHDTAAFHALFAPVIPDHGKMMHLFVVNADRSYFGHFHPIQNDSLDFHSALAGLPAGHFRLFGDIVLANGLSQTVTTTFDWPGDVDHPRPDDEDDSWWPSSVRDVGGITKPVSIGEGFTMTWIGGPSIGSGTPLDLQFAVRDARGAIASLQPYMGMAAHAVVLSSDDSVFVHLHPMGTVSSAAQAAFAARDRGDTTADGRFKSGAIDDTTMTRMPGMSFDGKLSFPYEFPRPGRYRIWVQVKPDKQILTGAFDIDVR